ncbi:hypothetical protein [Spirosoma sordidisoli]|uniref:Uncharacterized protein n=1 Tax=Spirosoma sordidisoli TaxID=2502893 RepID=A0A4Q2UM51_9BACT|nr:hypothetical protein [Spirosoma sordidisoli]RYC70687.1 hypothetical protein EQG79_00615 [Spirosoma sordidisoli]
MSGKSQWETYAFPVRSGEPNPFQDWGSQQINGVGQLSKARQYINHHRQLDLSSEQYATSCLLARENLIRPENCFVGNAKADEEFVSPGLINMADYVNGQTFTVGGEQRQILISKKRHSGKTNYDAFMEKEYAELLGKLYQSAIKGLIEHNAK